MCWLSPKSIHRSSLLHLSLDDGRKYFFHTLGAYPLLEVLKLFQSQTPYLMKAVSEVFEGSSKQEFLHNDEKENISVFLFLASQ